MRIAKPKRRSPGTPAPARDRRKRLASVVRRVSGAARKARTGATMVMVHMPGTIQATLAGAHGTTSALRALPDPTLRWLAAGSVGLGAGLSLAGAPRLLVAAGVAPALILGAAIVARPIDPDVRADGAERPKHGTNDG